MNTKNIGKTQCVEKKWKISRKIKENANKLLHIKKNDMHVKKK